jgi:hypothetical protein
VHALVPAVLLGLGGLDALDRDAQAQPSDREVAQPEEGTAAGEVGDSQRIAFAPVRKHELALVVAAPQVVGPAGPGELDALGPMVFFADPCDEPMPVQYRVRGADRRQTDPDFQAFELLADLRSPQLGCSCLNLRISFSI